jgi:hypothetical protein
VQFRREGPGMVLRVQLDRPGPAATAEESVSIQDCAAMRPSTSVGFGNSISSPSSMLLATSSP